MMNTASPVFRATLFGLAALFSATCSRAADARDEEIAALRALVTTLDQRLRVLEQERATERPPTVVAAPATAPAPVLDVAQMPKVTLNDRGFSLASGDEANVLRLRGFVQADYRAFFDDGGIAGNDTFLVRRGRFMVDGRFNRFAEFQVTPEFATATPTLLEANVNLVLSEKFQLRAGRFKAPLGLEQMQSDARTLFAEVAFPSQLTTVRDVGVMAQGAVSAGRLNYSVGLFNGVGDTGLAPAADGDDYKDVVARLFFQPFAGEKGSVRAGLGIGIGASTGHQTGTNGLTTGYRTDGRQVMFHYNSAAVADGDVTRLVPQASWYHGPIGIFGEYAQSTTQVRLTTTGASAPLREDAWQLAGSYVLTGEDASYRGVTPRSSFAPGAGTWGAWEIAARFSRLQLDRDTFPVFADPAASAAGATAFGVGVNWYLTNTVRATIDYFHTDFDLSPLASGTPTTPVIRQDEKTVITRLQLTF